MPIQSSTANTSNNPSTDPIDLLINRQGMNSIDTYIQYHHLVADAPHEPLMNETQLAEYIKQKSYNRIHHRIYVSYVNHTTGKTCRTIGPESKCFCGCTFKRHNTDSGNHVMACMNTQCQCQQYQHIPVCRELNPAH